MKRYEAYKAVQPLWNMTFPKHWEVFPLYSIAKEKSICNCTELELLSVYLDAGVVPFSKRTEKRTNATSKDLSKYQRVDPGDFVLNNQQAWRGSVGVSKHTGITSPAYIVLSMNDQLTTEYWAKKHNLKNASRAYLLYQEMGFDSPEAVAAACDAAHEKLSDIRTEMKSVEATIAEKKEFRDYVLNYHKTRYVVDELKACKKEKARQKYRDEHDSDFIILNAAKRYFDSKGLKKLPSYKALQTEVEQLIKEKNKLYNQYQTAKDEAQRLDTIRHNIEQTLGRKIERKQELER